MLTEELSGQAVPKSAHREALASMLSARNHKSIEFKHMNVSAVMLGLSAFANHFRERSFSGSFLILLAILSPR